MVCTSSSSSEMEMAAVLDVAGLPSLCRLAVRDMLLRGRERLVRVYSLSSVDVLSSSAAVARWRLVDLYMK